MPSEQTEQFDFDWLVIGSGFGGSVSALRLSEKGYSVGVLECGRRFEDKDFARSTFWQAHRYFWRPYMKLKGIFRITIFKDLSVVSGCGVGGGSLGYANTLYRASDDFYIDDQWNGLADWKSELSPHYDTAERMLGVVDYPKHTAVDDLILQLAKDFDREDTYRKTRVGVFFNDKPGKNVSDPYFDGEGPDRAGCQLCGNCMIGCRHNAKNTLVKNYLWFAERNGVKVMPERTVIDIKPIRSDKGKADGSAGYKIRSIKSGAWFDRDERELRARGVVVAAGALGTNQLLQTCKKNGSLRRLSKRLGELVRTNSEAILAVTAKNDDRDFTKTIAITSSFYPDEKTHIENTTYGPGADSMGAMFTLLTGEGSRVTRPLKLLAEIGKHPLRFVRLLVPYKWSQRTVIILVMQSLDNSIKLVPKWSPLPLVRLQTEEDPLKPNPRFIPAANKAAARAAEIIDGIPQSGSAEAIFNIPTTAHILGGAVIGIDKEHGVVDSHNRVFGYENLLVCDGAAVPANPGVNPSLTITALAEHAMAEVPPKAGSVAPDKEASWAAAKT